MSLSQAARGYWLSEGAAIKGGIGEPASRPTAATVEHQTQLPDSSPSSSSSSTFSNNGPVGPKPSVTAESAADYNSLLAKFTDGRAAAALRQKERKLQEAAGGGKGAVSSPLGGEGGTEKQIQQVKADVFASSIWALSVLVRGLTWVV